MGDLWKLNLLNNRFEQVEGSLGVGNRYMAKATSFDDNTLYLYGGYETNTSTYYDDIFEFNVNEKSLRMMHNGPVGRSNHIFD